MIEYFKQTNISKEYVISSLGNVVSLIKNKGLLKPYKDKRGYNRVKIMGKDIPIHRLVAIAFIPNPEFKKQVNHINGIKDDNRVENLEWCTNSENQIHALKNGLRYHNLPNKGKFGKDNHLSKCINQYTLDLVFIKTWLSQSDVQRNLGINSSSISSCCRGIAKSAGGFIWKFK